MGLITLELSDDLERELAKIAEKIKVSKARIVEEALRKYLELKKFRELREETLRYAERQDLYTDEDIFDALS